jgi:hypothetical protein
MNKLLLAVCGSALAVCAQPAFAAESVEGVVNFTNAQGNQTLNGTFGATKNSDGGFTDVFVFTLVELFQGTITIKTESKVGNVSFGDINLGPITINGITIPRTSGPNLTNETFTIAGITLNQGENTISVGGNVVSRVGGTAQYNGSVALTAASAVPEPATWAMMLFGFGAIGYSMRSRKSSYKLVQAV